MVSHLYSHSKQIGPAVPQPITVFIPTHSEVIGCLTFNVQPSPIISSPSKVQHSSPEKWQA